MVKQYSAAVMLPEYKTILGFLSYIMFYTTELMKISQQVVNLKLSSPDSNLRTLDQREAEQLEDMGDSARGQINDITISVVIV